MCLDKSEVGLAIFRWLAFHLRFFAGRQFCPQFTRDFLCQIGLDCKNVGDIAIVVVRPKMLVGIRINQLHVHSHLVSRATHAALENIGNAEGFADFADVRGLSPILHHRRARNHFQIADLRQVGKDVVLDAVGEIGVLSFVAQIFERQHCNRLVHLVRDSPR